jgi:hypothetical protein
MNKRKKLLHAAVSRDCAGFPEHGIPLPDGDTSLLHCTRSGPVQSRVAAVRKIQVLQRTQMRESLD